ncbi:MAG: DsrH/TusB family sulfur metabolism protein [Actinomycetota bacterium]|nr:DsrH/TusB family sulfur metabolism protein [Actinomycetota bacterium]MDA8173362.1 DsrH/TusB family sulfur metabolism protein [Nitrospiraceae bacterium]
MSLGVFVSDYKLSSDTLERLDPGKTGVILVLNGVWHALLKESGKASSLLDRFSKVYALSEDIETRGMLPAQVDGRVKVVNYDGLVDVVFNEFEKIAWL